MLHSILSSFARGYGRQMGRHAANSTRWLALPLLLLVLVLGALELGGGKLVAPLLGPVPSLLGPSLHMGKLLGR